MDYWINTKLLINIATEAAAGLADGEVDYWTIEGMRSQEFSVGIFIFMVIGILVFLGIIYNFIPRGPGQSRLKTGEKVMIAAIILGVIVATGFGAVQLLSGRLF